MQRKVTAYMKCELYEKCSFADPDSFTCNQDNDGKYCGKYRLLKAGQSAQSMSSEHSTGKKPAGQPSRNTTC